MLFENIIRVSDLYVEEVAKKINDDNFKVDLAGIVFNNSNIVLTIKLLDKDNEVQCIIVESPWKLSQANDSAIRLSIKPYIDASIYKLIFENGNDYIEEMIKFFSKYNL
jgi:hypothetical protein